jgi:Tol biopolymer transport system component
MQRLQFLKIFFCRLGLGCALLALTCSSCAKKIDSQRTNLLTTVRISLGNQNQLGNGPVGNAAVDLPGPGLVDAADISDEGRFVAFSSSASNMVPNDNNNAADVFLRDNVQRTTTLVSINLAGTGPANAASWSPSVSGDGRFVAFISTATDISADKADTIQDIFVRDMTLNTTTLISRATGPLGVKSNGPSFAPHISKNGRYVVFYSRATNLDPADADINYDIYRRDFGDPTAVFPTILISRQTGVAGIKGSGGGGTGSLNPSISRDGHIIVYESDAFNIVTVSSEGGPLFYSPPSTTFFNIYLRDCNANSSLRLSVAAPGGPSFDPDDVSHHPSVSGDGNFVTFQSNASNVVFKTDHNPDIYWRDVRTLETAPGAEIISVHTSGVRAGSGCDFPVLSEDGSMVVWNSPSTTLVDNDTNAVKDIFLHDRRAGVTSRPSVSTFGGELNAQSLKPALSGNGLYIVFYTQATNTGDPSTGAADYYLRGPPF